MAPSARRSTAWPVTSSPVPPAIAFHRRRAVSSSPGLPTSSPPSSSIESQPISTASGWASPMRRATVVAFAAASRVTFSAGEASGIAASSASSSTSAVSTTGSIPAACSTARRAGEAEASTTRTTGEPTRPAASVERGVGRRPEVPPDGVGLRGFDPLGQQDPHEVLGWVGVPGRAQAAVPAVAAGGAPQVAAAQADRDAETPAVEAAEGLLALLRGELVRGHQLHRPAGQDGRAAVAEHAGEREVVLRRRDQPAGPVREGGRARPGAALPRVERLERTVLSDPVGGGEAVEVGGGRHEAGV